jgi:hypothetical protein
MANDFDLALRLQVRSHWAAAPHGRCLAEPNVPQREFDEERGEEQRRMREVRAMRMQLRPGRSIIRCLGLMMWCQYTPHAAWLASLREMYAMCRLPWPFSYATWHPVGRTRNLRGG